MADLVSSVAAYLLTQASISAIVGESIQPIPSPVDQALYPCIAYQVVSDTGGHTLTGPDGVAHARILFSCSAWNGPGSYGTAHTLGLAVKRALNGYEGTLPNGPQVFYADAVNVTDLYQADAMLSTTNVSVLFTYQD
jgi:hypothetical protein